MFAKESLDEIEQWRRTTTSSRHQLDWRWVERFRTLVSYDTYWWLTPTGPFTEEEQSQWKQMVTQEGDEITKARLGTLLSQAQHREIMAAIAEQREPRFHYPALDIEEVHTRMAGLLQLDTELLEGEPNVIVRRLYHEAIEEELDTLRVIEATYERNSERFWEYMQRIIPSPTPAEMNIALSRVKHFVLRGLLRPDTKEASERLIQLLHEQCGLSLDLSYTDEEAQELHTNVPLPLTQPQHKISAQASKHFFEAVLQESGFDGWQVAIDPNATSARVEQGLRCLFLPDRSLSVKQIRHLLSHELAGHVSRCVAGERSLLGLLGIHTKNALETEEGLAVYYDMEEEKRQSSEYGEKRVWPGTLATGLASGVLTPPQTFLSLLAIFEALFFLRRLLARRDPDEATARKIAQELAISNCLRTYRGVPDLEQAGVCFTQDALYLRGLQTIKRVLAVDVNVLDCLSVGVVSVEQLPDLLELGIRHAPQPLRILAENPALDTYIMSFDETEKQAVQSDERNIS